MIEIVEKRFEGWEAKLLLKDGELVLLRLVLAVILIFHLSVYKLPIRVGRGKKD